MSANISGMPDAGTEVRSDREKLIRLLSALMARRWWREQRRAREVRFEPDSAERPARDEQRAETDNS